MKTLIIFGLFLEILGAFFLSVEAIKLENIQKLKEKYLLPAFSHSLSPRVFIEGDEEQIMKAHALGSRDSEKWPAGIYQGLHWIAGFLVVVSANFLTNGLILLSYIWVWYKVLNWSWYFSIPVGIYYFFVSTFLLWFIGEGIHILLRRSIQSFLWLSDLILSKSQSGTTGMLGFFILFMGFIFQIIGTALI